MKKRIISLMLACCAACALLVSGCSSSAPSPSESEASEAAAVSESASDVAAAGEESAEEDSQIAADAGSTSGPAMLTEESELLDVTYMVSPEWQSSASESSAAYAFPVGDDIPCSIMITTVAASTLEASGGTGEDVASVLLALLEVEDPSVTPASFKGADGYSFTGSNSEGLDLEGYIAESGDVYYTFIFLSTDIENPEVAAVWGAFQEGVSFK